MNKKSYLLMIIPYLLKFKFRILISLLLIIWSRILSVANPYIIKELVDSLSKNDLLNLDKNYLVFLVILFFAFRWWTDLFDWIKDYIFSKVTISVKKLISFDIFKHLLNLPVEFHTNQATGWVARKITRWTWVLSNLSFFLVNNIIPTIIEIIFIIIVFLKLFPIKFSIVFIIFVITYVVYTIVITNKRQEILLETNKKDDKTSEISIDALMNFETVKYFTNEKYEFNKYSKVLKERSEIAVISIQKLANLNIWQWFILSIWLASLLYFAVFEYFNWNASLWDFVLITTYISRISMPLSFLGSMYRIIKESLANLDEMFKLFDVKNNILDKKDAKIIKNIKWDIKFKDVIFWYNKERIVIDNVSIDIPAWKRIAFVWTSWSWKSTISKLILRFYDVNSGEILIDWINIKDLTQESLRENIWVVAQDTILFNDTIYNNILYWNTNANKDEIINAAKIANIHKFIKNLPNSYETKVWERWIKLSWWEKQRIAIARMLLKNPKILIFDEATSNLDMQSEKIVQDSIKEISKKWKTTIVIAHRLSTISDFDIIYVVDKWKIIEKWTHSELIKHNWLYKKLWEVQKINSSEI